MTMHLLLTVLQRLVLSAVLCAGASAWAQQTMVHGVNTLWPPGDRESLSRRFALARSLGVQHVRTDWEWRAAEAKKGHYDWRALDTLVQAAQAQGVELLPIVHYAPDWALVEGKKPAQVYEMAPSPQAYADFARFLFASVKRYGPGGNAPFAFTPITHWQVWNEPNIREFWGPRPDALAFSRLMQAVQHTLAPLRPKAQLVHAGLSKADLVFMWQLWEANPRHAETFDIMAVHPYLFDGRDGVRSAEAMDADDRKASAMGFVGSTTDPGFLGKVFNLQLFMTLRGAPDRPIWITELGFFVGSHKLGVSEAGQAQRLQGALDFIQRRLGAAPYDSARSTLRANVQRVYWFSLEDYPAPDGVGSFGLVRPDGSERPAARALRSFMH